MKNKLSVIVRIPVSKISAQEQDKSHVEVHTERTSLYSEYCLSALVVSSLTGTYSLLVAFIWGWNSPRPYRKYQSSESRMSRFLWIYDFQTKNGHPTESRSALDLHFVLGQNQTAISDYLSLKRSHNNVILPAFSTYGPAAVNISVWCSRLHHVCSPPLDHQNKIFYGYPATKFFCRGNLIFQNPRSQRDCHQTVKNDTSACIPLLRRRSSSLPDRPI